MLSISNLVQTFVMFASLLINLGHLNQSVLNRNNHLGLVVSKTNIANLADGNYQFCSQPDTHDWRVGVGVCANFQKTVNRFMGYYGYPHSDSFVCIRGEMKGNLITGEALSILWDSTQQDNVPKSAFLWDSEGRLKLSEGNLISTANHHEDALQRILYRQAWLNLEGFYQYNRPRMTSPSQLCEWN